MFPSMCRHTSTHMHINLNRVAEQPSHSIEFVLKIIALFLFQCCVTTYKHMQTTIMHVMPIAIVNKTSFRCSELSRYVFRSNKIALIRCRMIFLFAFANFVNVFTQNESFPSIGHKADDFFSVCRFDEKQKKNVFYSKSTHKHTTIDSIQWFSLTV